MNDLDELKQLRRIAKAARRLLDAPIWSLRGDGLSRQYGKALDALEAAVRDWEPESTEEANNEPAPIHP